MLDTHIHKPGSYPFDLIAPITVMWKPLQPPVSNDSDLTENQSAPQGTTSSLKKGKNKGKGKAKATKANPSSALTPPVAPSARIVWIRAHPAVFDEVFSTFQASASSILETLKRPSDPVESQSTEIEIADLRETINVFEIMGPKSNQVLKGALSPVGEDKREEFKKVNT